MSQQVLRYPRVAAQLARGGALRARARFTWNGIAQQILGVLQTVERPVDDLAGTTDAAPDEPEVRGPRSLVSVGANVMTDDAEWTRSGS